MIPENNRAAAFGFNFAMLGGATGPMLGGLWPRLNSPGFVADAASFGLLLADLPVYQ